MLKTRKLLRRGLIIDGTNKGTCLQATKYWTAIDFSLGYQTTYQRRPAPRPSPQEYAKLMGKKFDRAEVQLSGWKDEDSLRQYHMVNFCWKTNQNIGDIKYARSSAKFV